LRYVLRRPLAQDRLAVLPDHRVRLTLKRPWSDEVNLEANLQGLLDRFKLGTYVAPPVRRVHIPKGDGRTRPIGIPTLEDKILQRAVAMVLEAIYEQDFKSSSYGFRG
jgi:retron-type reverse transcriptase